MSLIPWTSPRSWITGEVLTAALLNLHLRDNLLFAGEPPRARVRLTTTKTNIPGGSTVDVAPVTVDEDTAGAVNATNGTFTVPAGAGGLYLITARMRSDNASGTNGAGLLRISLNGGLGQQPALIQQAGANTVETTGATMLRLVAADIVKLQFTASGTTANLSGVSNSYNTGFEITRLTV